ncbi:HEAT repeat domain-containing protein [Halorussus marinus]|uniref:HEAT repeat domain-containing protein n=1 Tax=Halorussus marinus TaxID=2505976 RepID=UPI00106E0EDD|nr:HEAT repeat domain-containing protein [Halorussus marinus]
MNGTPAVSVETLSLIGAVVTSLLAVVGLITIGRSVLTARRDRRTAQARGQIRRAFLERMEATDPAWDDWVTELNETERRVAQDLLREYLERVRGRDRQSLQRLGYALGLDRRARRKLREGDRFERRWALNWIARLDVDVPTASLERTCEEHPDASAPVARVLYEQDRPEAARIGTELLLRGSRPLSVLGVDSLYQLNKLSPAPLFERATSSYDEWSESRLIQVLRVIGEAGPANPDTSLGWIGFLFVSSSPAVRAAAAESLVGYGWHEDVRAAVDVERIRTDESPRVRGAIYRMLGTWQDEASTAALLAAIGTETDPRSAIDAISALGERARDLDETELSAASAAAREWVLASTEPTKTEAVR